MTAEPFPLRTPDPSGRRWHVDEAAHAPDVEIAESELAAGRGGFASFPHVTIALPGCSRSRLASWNSLLPGKKTGNSSWLIAASPRHRQRLRSPSTEVLASLAWDSSPGPRPQARPSVDAA